MFPSKSMVDYMSEMNRLFSGSESENAYNAAAQSPLNSTINRSSSSADSTSPESYPEVPTYRPEFHLRPMPEVSRPYESFDWPNPMCETPRPSQFMPRCQRPIVGRKILPENPKYERVQVSPVAKREYDANTYTTYQDETILYQHTPPNVNNIFVEHKYYTNFYELFPSDTKGYEFKTPVKTSPTMSNISNVSPMSPMSNVSSSSMNQSPMRQMQSRSPSVRSYRSGYSDRFTPEPGQKLCTFCKKNGETPVVYMTHSVKEKVGNKYIVSCPILRKHLCSTCGASGDNAHTITYCPVLRSSNNGRPLESTTVTLKNTRVKSNGMRRY